MKSHAFDATVAERVGIPDRLYYEEIEQGSPGLEDLGLQVTEVSGDFVAYVQQLQGQYNPLLPTKN